MLALFRLVCCALVIQVVAAAQVPFFPIVSIGDSLGEGVQSGDANSTTQAFSYPNFVNSYLGIPFPQPLIQPTILGYVGSTDGRTRIDPSLLVANIAVSGATVGDLLRDVPDTALDSHIDLVMHPYPVSQIEAAEILNSYVVMCWIGSNDALQAVTSFDQLNATQMTPVAQFEADYYELVERLYNAGRPAIYANLPDVDKIAFLVDRDDLIRFLGNDYGLPAGYKTSAVELLLLLSGFDDGTNLQNPNYVLDPTEQALIQNRIDAFNQIIAAAVGSVGMPLVDVNAAFDDLVANPPVFGGVTLRTNFLGGLFSLDGVHPSNIGHALVANLFLEKMNEAWGFELPLLPPSLLEQVALSDPFVDADGDGSVPGRPYTSLLETLAALVGVSGDSSNSASRIAPTVNSDDLLTQSKASNGAGSAVKRGKSPKDEVTEALARAFGAKAASAPGRK